MSTEGPTVAIVGATGYMGKYVTAAFITAMNEGRLKELRILTTKKSEAVEDLKNQGVKINIVDFSSMETLMTAFKGADVVVSTLGTGPGTQETKKALLNAIAEARVKIYFPSEFGTNHYSRIKSYKHPIFEEKKKHFKEAQAKNIKVIGILCSDAMEGTFGPWFGLDTKAEVWSLVGTGEVPVAVTAERDIGRFTVEAVLLAFKDTNTIPDLIEVYSDMRTMRGYAQAFDKVAGRKTELKFTPLNEAADQYNSSQSFEYLLQILFEEGAYNYTDAKGNELLNPGEARWKLKTIDEYSKETGGRPWKDYELPKNE